MSLPKAIADEMRKKQASGRLRLVKPPRLEQGDHLTRDEFERRYDAMPNLKKAELIEGIVYMPSPVRHREHGKQHIRMAGLILLYSTATPGTDCSDNATVRLDSINGPQPDILLFIDESAGGNTRISEDGYIEGAPELVVEISASTESYDLHAKLEAYRRNGVKEYIVWCVLDNEIKLFRLRGNHYVKAKPDTSGVIRSKVFPGLQMDVEALLNDDMKTALNVVQEGLKSKEHAAFVKRLSQPSRPKKQKAGRRKSDQTRDSGTKKKSRHP